MSRHTPFFELQTALGAPGCALCALARQTLTRFFSALVYEQITDTSRRALIRNAYGFCATHGAMLCEARSALGIAIVQRDVLRAAARAIGGSANNPARGWRTTLFGARGSDPIGPHNRCPACELADKTVAEWVDLLTRRYSELRPDFQASSGLCLDHLRVTLAHGAGEADVALREDQLAIWARLEAELDEFIRKHDHQFAGEEVGSERDSWSRATALLAGDWQVMGSLRTH